MQCTARFAGQVSRGKAHLGSATLRFSGDFRLSIPFAHVKSVETRGGRLRVAFRDGLLVLDLGPRAETWALQIRSPKRLIDKLGVKPDARVALLGVRDEHFLRELQERSTHIAAGRLRKGSDAIFLLAGRRQDLAKLARLQEYLKPNGAIWVVAPRGGRQPTERDVLAAGNAVGLVDVKVVRFSDSHTAHKFVIPLARR